MNFPFLGKRYKMSYQQVAHQNLLLLSRLIGNKLYQLGRSRKFLCSIAIVTSLLIYYQWLNYLYLLDEVYDGDKLRELSIDEKFTIRVSETADFKPLKRFIEKYSLCPSVYEIQVAWRSSKSERLPVLSDFTFAHTHSKVLFDHTMPEMQYATILPQLLPIDTEGGVNDFKL